MANERKTDYFIKELLDDAGIRCTPNGSDIKEINDALRSASKKGTGHRGFPEFVGVSEDFAIVIENKALRERQALYEDEARQILSMEQKAVADYAENGALHYARIIADKTSFKKIFAFGCSGDDRGYAIRPIYVDEQGYRIMAQVENFKSFSRDHIVRYYREQLCGETPEEALELESILKKATVLHEELRNYGQLGDSEKPLVVSAILLALREKSFHLDALDGDAFDTDGQKIYNALSTHLDRIQVQPETKRKRILNQFTVIKDRPLLNRRDDRLDEKEDGEDDSNDTGRDDGRIERLGKTPLKYFAEYLEKEILNPIITNSQEDVLGRFYSEFIRYSGGDGQSLGVVLTPRHITELFCALADVKPTDVVFDPCCGTGGFPIAAMNYMYGQTDDPDEKKTIRDERIHGMEIREDMFTVFCTNMILRDAGINNVMCDDFLRYPVEKLRDIGYTVGFMNPPYSQAKGKGSAHLAEIHFIKHLLDGMADGGRGIVVVPQSVMVGKTKVDKMVKQEILEDHTLEGVITLNKETFYRVGTNPCIAVFTAHRPHPMEKYCKFVNFEDDGFVVNKHVGLVKTERAQARRQQLISCWHHDQPADNRFMVKTPIKPEDEWLHSFYYFNDEIPSEEDFEKVMADYLTFAFDMIAHGRGYLFDGSEPSQEKPDGKKKG